MKLEKGLRFTPSGDAIILNFEFMNPSLKASLSEAIAKFYIAVDPFADEE